MFTAAELIAQLEARYRRRFPLHADRPFGQFPPTWRQWFLSMQARSDAVTGAPAEDFVTIFAARPLAARPKAPSEIGRLPALLRLLVRQQWEPALPEDRGMRRFAAVFSGTLHFVFAMLLLWLAVVAIDPAPKRQNDAGETVLVEYIGVGTPENTGGAAAQGADETPPPSNAIATPATSPQAPPETLPEEAAPPEMAVAQPSVEPTPEPPTPSPPVAQPLMVSEPKTPPEEEPVFSLPPPRARTAQTTAPRALREPELRPSDTEVELLEPRPPVRALQHREVARTPTTPELRTRPAEVEMLEPLPSVSARTPTPRAPAPQLRTPTLRTAPGEIAMRQPASPAPPGPPAPSTSNAPPSRETRTTAIEGGGPVRESPNDGGRPTAKPGGLPSPRRSDDWGDSTQTRPGNSTAGRGDKPGLFNPDGSIRVPSGDGRAGGGLPPGTITEDFEKIDRMGTWLKRPPTDYTPSRLESLFVPSESLLEEWVRRNVREVFVPIPGTKKRIVCKVSLLQAGGGCFIDDPNMRDQEAEARKPPDVPFKPDLQEN